MKTSTLTWLCLFALTNNIAAALSNDNEIQQERTLSKLRKDTRGRELSGIVNLASRGGRAGRATPPAPKEPKEARKEDPKSPKAPPVPKGKGASKTASKSKAPKGASKSKAPKGASKSKAPKGASKSKAPKGSTGKGSKGKSKALVGRTLRAASA